MAFLWLVLIIFCAGCIQVQTPSPPEIEPPNSTPSAFLVSCLVVDEGGHGLRGANCRFRFPNLDVRKEVADNGTASQTVPAGSSGELVAFATWYKSKTASLTVDGPKVVRFVLSPVTYDLSGGSSSTTTSDEPAPAYYARPWLAPLTVNDPADGYTGSEPQIVVAPDGTVYYTPSGGIYRSTDGGATFQDISPELTIQVDASDTSASVAPDGALWWTRWLVGYSQTIACRSLDRGDTWTCNEKAILGSTDRMWIAGISKDEAWLESQQGGWLPVFAHTTDGGQSFMATAVSQTGSPGNMAYDSTKHGVWQVRDGTLLQISRIDTATGLVDVHTTSVAGTTAIPSLAAWNGTLWVTGQPMASDAISRRLVVARSTNGGYDWEEFPIGITAKTVTFAYVAAGPHNRTAVVYYGSDTAGPPDNNGGTWSLYVSETSNANDPQPTWIETRVAEAIHKGSICIGGGCEGSTSDPNARFALDLMGIWIDADGNTHVAYEDDSSGTALNRYARQRESP